MDLDLPESTTAQITKKNNLSISISPGETGPQIFVDKQPVSLDELARHLEPFTGGKKEVQVLLFGDKTTPYQQLYKVLDELKKAGITTVSMQASTE